MKNRWIIKTRRNAKYVFDLFDTERIRLNVLRAIPFWIASLLTGLIAVGFTKLFVYAENLLKEVLNWKQWSIFLWLLYAFCLPGSLYGYLLLMRKEAAFRW